MGTILTKRFKVFSGIIYVGNPIRKIGKNIICILKENKKFLLLKLKNKLSLQDLIILLKNIYL